MRDKPETIEYAPSSGLRLALHLIDANAQIERERDEARAEVERLRHLLEWFSDYAANECFCQGCGGVTACIKDCTFAADEPFAAEKLRLLRVAIACAETELRPKEGER